MANMKILMANMKSSYMNIIVTIMITKLILTNLIIIIIIIILFISM